MKIKDVITETGLTDRAIRLYIENGLVAPSCSESYAGRKNIDFTSEDVERLKNIATLRKAGFSIADIKTLFSNSEKAPDIVRLMISDQEEKAKTSTKVAEKLKRVLENKEITVVTICDALNNFTADKVVPKEDTEISLLSKIVRALFLILGSVSLLFGLLLAVQFYSYEVKGWNHYLYPKYTFPECLLLLLPLPTIVLALHFTFSFRKHIFSSKKKRFIKNIISLTLAALLVWFTVYEALYLWVTSLDDYPGVVISETDDFENYMSFDSEAAEIILSEFLPQEISELNVTDYLYTYEEYGISHEPPSTTVFLELELSEKEFNELVEKYKAFRPEDSTCEPDVFNSTYWTIIFYRENDERSPSDYAPVFAYDKYINRVRFICEYGRISTKGYSKEMPDICYW